MAPPRTYSADKESIRLSHHSDRRSLASQRRRCAPTSPL